MNHSIEYPTAFWQELFIAMPDHAWCRPELFKIIVTETHDSENYRIEHHPENSNSIYSWEGNDWPTVLEECVEAQKTPF